MIENQHLIVKSLGEARYPSPLKYESVSGGVSTSFVADDDRLRLDLRLKPETDARDPLSVEEAGPRERIFFDPSKTTAAVVTCGGLSPGLNNVLRSLFYELSQNYGVTSVLGIRNGYLGLNPKAGLEPVRMSREFVERIDKLGGTVLGSSRGPQEPAVMADYLESAGIDMLFCIGGDGTQRGTQALHEELEKRGAKIALVGIPKTIDNDIPFVRLSFGFATALEKAAEVICGAHVEARDAINGIGLVKLMGRHAGFIAAGATLVSQEANFTLVPEVPFPLEGANGFLPALEDRIRERGHAVIVVAEGAGQHLFENMDETRDASGNLLHEDIGVFLRQKIAEHFRDSGIEIALKYLDPSYLIRSIPANAYDRVLCDQLARHAVHAAMAGKTGVMVGHEHGRYINVPIPAVSMETKQVGVDGELWRGVLQVTRQPCW